MCNCAAFFATIALVASGCYGNVDQLERRMSNFDQRLASIEHTMNVMEGRQQAVVEEFKKEMTILDRDTVTTKTVINRLVEDSVKVAGQIQYFQGVDKEVQAMHHTIDNMEKTVQGEVNGVKEEVHALTDKLNEEAEANTKISVMMTGKMNSNAAQITRLQATLNAEEQKQTRLENKINALESSGGNGNSMQKIQQLQQQLNKLIDELNSLKPVVEEMKQVVLM